MNLNSMNLNSIFLLCIFVLFLAGCPNSDSGKNKDAGITKRNSSPQGDEKPTVDQRIQSTVLQEAFRKTTTQLMASKQPTANQEQLASEAIQFADNAILEFRKINPDFLMVSEQTEKKLMAGKISVGTTQRIKGSRNVFQQYGIEMPELIDYLLQQHDNESLSPAQTELLAQTISTSAKKLMKSLQK